MCITVDLKGNNQHKIEENTDEKDPLKLNLRELNRGILSGYTTTSQLELQTETQILSYFAAEINSISLLSY
jgi:hypothetical protein